MAKRVQLCNKTNGTNDGRIKLDYSAMIKAKGGEKSLGINDNIAFGNSVTTLQERIKYYLPGP